MAISTINNSGLAAGTARANFGAGAVLQVVSTFFTSQASSTSATPANVSGFAASITPASSSNKILVTVFISFGFANDAYPYALLTRNGTSIFTGTGATGAQVNTFASGTGTNASSSTPWRYTPVTKMVLDSPNTTSELTYQIQLASPYQGLAGYINRQSATNNDSYIQFPGSSITLMEIAA